MGQETFPPPGWNAVARALRGYAEHLSRAFAESRPAVQPFAELVERAVDPSARGAAGTWSRGHVLAAWPEWRPHRLDRRVIGAGAARLANRCRECLGHSEPRTTRSWKPFARSPGDDSDGLRELLGDCRAFLQSLTTPLTPQLADALSEAVPLARIVDDHIAALPADWTPLRLARAVAPLGADWPDPPANGGDSFLALLWHLLEQVLSAGESRPDPTLLQSLFQEAAGELIAAVRAGNAGPDWLWPRVAEAWAAIPSFPALDLAGGQLRWPEDVPLCQPGASFRPDDSPAGVPIAVERFASAPEAARFVVSLGPIGAPGAPVRRAAARLWAASKHLASGLCDAVRPAVAPALRGESRITPESLFAILDVLLPQNEAYRAVAAGGAAESLDSMLVALRDWASLGGLSVLPADWTFAGGAQWPVEPPAGVTAKPLFRAQDPVGRVFRVRAFGVAAGGEILRPAEVAVSAGPAPSRLPELEAAGEAAPDNVMDRLRDALQALRPAGLGGYLEQSAIDLYTTFWEQHPVWAATDSGAADTFAGLLELSLAETFSLSAFRPQTFREHPEGWVRVPAGTRMTTGRVVRVLRPGLVDARSQLRVPARVEAE